MGEEKEQNCGAWLCLFIKRPNLFRKPEKKQNHQLSPPLHLNPFSTKFLIGRCQTKLPLWKEKKKISKSLLRKRNCFFCCCWVGLPFPIKLISVAHDAKCLTSQRKYLPGYVRILSGKLFWSKSKPKPKWSVTEIKSQLKSCLFDVWEFFYFYWRKKNHNRRKGSSRNQSEVIGVRGEKVTIKGKLLTMKV